MKKLLLFFAGASLMFFNVFGQTEIVKWSFTTGQSSDTFPTISNPLNSMYAIRSVGTTTITITNGQGSGDYAATATGWDNGADAKYWYVSFVTTGYNGIRISSKQRAGGTNGGPVDFKVQYKIDMSGSWTDVPNGTVTSGNNWTAGVVSNLSLPQECEDQPLPVSVRWIMVTNNDINGGSVAATGVSKIDDIIVTGNAITTVDDIEPGRQFSVYPNPSDGFFTVEHGLGAGELVIYDISGKIVYNKTLPGLQEKINLSGLEPGVYFISAVNGKQGKREKLIIQ